MFGLKLCVVVVLGMPLTGKSALAEALARETNLVNVDVDEVRQFLFPNPDRILFPPEVETPVMVSSYTYVVAKARWLVERLDTPVCLTGTFSRPEFKRPLQEEYSDGCGGYIPFRFFLLTAPDEEIERRIEKRQREESPSNINTLDKFLWAKGFFQPITFAPVMRIERTNSPEKCAEEVLGHLADLSV